MTVNVRVSQATTPARFSLTKDLHQTSLSLPPALLIAAHNISPLPAGRRVSFAGATGNRGSTPARGEAQTKGVPLDFRYTS